MFGEMAKLQKFRPVNFYANAIDAFLDLCPADRRIQAFLNDYFTPFSPVFLPRKTLILDKAGMARALSLPPDVDKFESDIITSYRVKQGVLHNPKNDRRTTQGVFHVAEGGLAIPDDKIAVPKAVFHRIFQEAWNAPARLMSLPFTPTQAQAVQTFAALLLRPIVCPEIAGIMPQKTMEIRFFAPGNLISNIDFVESIFGNAGDPFLPQNDAALDAEHWTGHTGCVILAPHLTGLRKKDLGLPHREQATPRQKRDKMCWESPEEFYNDGEAFKITCRDKRGVIVTVIADNYFGYCKKEVKTQISFAANLYGLAEEEHSGGAIAFAAYDLGEEFELERLLSKNDNTFEDVLRLLGDEIEIKKEGYAIKSQHPDIVFVPGDARFDLLDRTVSWKNGEKKESIRLLAHHTYILPSGYRIYMKKQTGGQSWHLVGTVAEGVHCHKPCTVSGGGKSEISKSITDAMIQGPVFTGNFKEDFLAAEAILKRDYSDRFKPEFVKQGPSRPLLDSKRSLGSVIKLLTVSPEYTDHYNAWLKSIPDHVKELVFTVKRFYQPAWGDCWQSRFSVDIVNGHMGHELRFNNRKLTANYLRVGRTQDHSWRIFRVRPDFCAAEKIQTADDITVSVTIPRQSLKNLSPWLDQPSVKLIANCEMRLFQRPDDAIYRGYDKQAEADIASHGAFLSNFEPLGVSHVRQIVEDAVLFDAYSEPMKKLLVDFLADDNAQGFVVSSAHLRLVDGAPTKNPRYLQERPDRAQPKKTLVASICARLFRGMAVVEPVYWPVNAVLTGRRNNPADSKAGVPALAVYNPIHFQELPELFLDFICSLTGKSPSTTGFGSEGALTKGPFNALLPIVDLNNAFVSLVMGGYDVFSSAAGTIGPNYRVDHDISLLVPEIWCRMRPEEQRAQYLIRGGYLEQVRDFEHRGKRVRASVLGYRITQRFVNTFLGRIFSNPSIVFNEEMLKPETQDIDTFVEGLNNIFITQKRVAEHYFHDGSVEAAVPPLRALLHVMRDGHFEGKDIRDPGIRALFTKESVLKSDWYKHRLKKRQEIEKTLWKRHQTSLEEYLRDTSGLEQDFRDELKRRLEWTHQVLSKAENSDYWQTLFGTIGADVSL
jgi:hypothetical protein